VENLFRTIYKSYDYIVNRAEEEPPLIPFLNLEKALELLQKHLNRTNKILVHCDVDMDGIGSGYIVNRVLNYSGSGRNTLVTINKDKKHGINEKHVKFCSLKNIDLFIIVDSSSNDINLIKQFPCDVIVVDHHELEHSEYFGDTEKGTFVIISNMIENKNGMSIKELGLKKDLNTVRILENYHVDVNMSCGRVVYELFRWFALQRGFYSRFREIGLDMWVGITLFSDSISLDTPDNQYYIGRTVENTCVESTVKSIIKAINSYKSWLDKSFINYGLVPLINKPIRAGKSSEVIDVVLNRPEDIKELEKYTQEQDEIVTRIHEGLIHRQEYVMKDITKTDIPDSYKGIIATRMVSEYGKNAFVFRTEEGITKGSFRGALKGIDYRLKFRESNIKALGHKAAFGVEGNLDDIINVLKNLEILDKKLYFKNYISLGGIGDVGGLAHVDDIKQFKRGGNIYRLATINACVSTEEETKLVVGLDDVEFRETKGKVFLYDCMGLPCIAFEPINTGIVEMYPELIGGEVKTYLRNWRVKN
jgi:hypothetical protein